MTKSLVSFMLIVCFITTSLGIGYAVNFFDLGDTILKPVVKVVDGATKAIEKTLGVFFDDEKFGKFYYARWYLDENEYYYVDLRYEVDYNGDPTYYILDANVDVESFAIGINTGTLILVTNERTYFTDEPFYRERYIINDEIYATHFRWKYMTRDRFYQILRGEALPPY